MPYLTNDGARLWWHGEGAGQPVLLIMGLGYPAKMWYRVTPALTSDHHVVIFDNRGAGHSDSPPGPYSIEQMASDAAAVLEAALAESETGAASGAVVGISLGGIIAMELVFQRPDLVNRLALVSTHPAGKEGVPPEPDVLKMITDRSNMSALEAARVAVPYVYAADTDPELIEEDIAVRMEQPTRRSGYDNQLRAVLGYDGAHSRLGTIGVPVLVLHGTADRLVPPANGQIIADAIPSSRLVWLEGAGHIVTTDRTGELNAALRAFLAPAP